MVTELHDGIYWFDLTGVNAYLVDSDSQLTLIDAGTRFDAATIRDGVAAAGYRLDDLDQILITHYDVDHVGALGKLDTAAPIYIGSDDKPFLTNDRKPSFFGKKSFLQRISRPLIPKIESTRIKPVSDGDTISNFTAYHTPGHTSGHMVYHHSPTDSAFLGDLIFARKESFSPSPWIITADTTTAKQSIKSCADSISFEIAAMGHGTPRTDNGSELLTALAARI